MSVQQLYVHGTLTENSLQEGVLLATKGTTPENRLTSSCRKTPLTSTKEAKGKSFEALVQEALQEEAKVRPLVVHRFYDTYAAGDYLPSQPGDFLVVYRGLPMLLELKSSCVHESLRGCFSNAVPPGQIGSHILWRRAEARCWFLFGFDDGKRRAYEMWPSAACIKARERGKPLRLADRYGLYPTIEEMLNDLLDITNERTVL